MARVQIVRFIFRAGNEIEGIRVVPEDLDTVMTVFKHDSQNVNAVEVRYTEPDSVDTGTILIRVGDLSAIQTTWKDK